MNPVNLNESDLVSDPSSLEKAIPSNALRTGPSADLPSSSPVSSRFQDLFNGLQSYQDERRTLSSPMRERAISSLKQADMDTQAFRAGAEQSPIPPVDQFRNNMNVFKNLAPIIAIFGSAFTKEPLLNAMAAATGAMEGYREGDEKRIRLNIEKHEKAMETYKARQEQLSHSIQFDSKNAEAWASAMGNDMLLGIARQNPLEAAKIYEMVTKAEASLIRAQNEGASGYSGKKRLEAIIADPEATDEERERALNDLKTIYSVEHYTPKWKADREQTIQRLSGVSEKIKELREQIEKNPTLVGTKGKIQQYGQHIGGQVGQSVSPESTAFQAKLNSLAIEMTPLLQNIRGGETTLKHLRDLVDVTKPLTDPVTALSMLKEAQGMIEEATAAAGQDGTKGEPVVSKRFIWKNGRLMPDGE